VADGQLQREQTGATHTRPVLFSWIGCTSSVFIFLLQEKEKDKLWTSAASSAKKNRSIELYKCNTEQVYWIVQVH